MDYRFLGNTSIKVSELCFGVLPMGPLQANKSPQESGRLLSEAFDQGINFIDTAEMYQTYPHIAYGLKESKVKDLVIASKSTALDYQGMEKSLTEALKAMGRDVIDIFHLHAAKATPQVFQEREGAIECLLKYKEMGYIRAIGISTHNVQVVARAAEIPEIDVVYPIINKVGRGILEGSVEEMLEAINICHHKGKGLYAMKVLAGGNLVGDLLEAIKFARGIAGMDSISLGMINKEELGVNLSIFNNENITEEMLPKAVNSKKIFILQNICKKCGKCIKVCPNGALALKDQKLIVNHWECLLCGYCYPVCPEFAIRMI